MIGFHGFRGAGKTLSAVAYIYRLYKKHKQNFVLYTNTPVNFGKDFQNQFIFHEVQDLYPMFQLAMTYPEEFLQKQTIIFIDEASVAMPSVMWKDTPEFVRLLLAESRKLNIDIIYTTQHPARVYNILRELTETWIKCTNFWNVLILQREQFISPSVTQIEEISSSTLIYPRRFYGIYDTHYIVGMDKFKISKQQKDQASEDERKLLEFTEKLYFKEDLQPVDIQESISE